MSSVLERLVQALFSGPAEPVDEADRPLVDDAIEAFVETVEPRVRLSSGYREKLAGPVARTIAHLRELGQAPLGPVLLCRAAWSEDPRVHAFFAAADDVPDCLGRSEELQRFFDEHPACDEAYALLGMRRDDRQVFAPRLEGEVLRHDVAQTTVSFSGHRLIAPAADVAQARREVGRRILQRLAQQVLERIVALGHEAEDLQQRRAMLGMKLRMLQRGRDGMQALVDDGAPVEQQIRDVEQELKQASAGYAEAKGSLDTLDDYIEQMNAVLDHPEQHVTLQRQPLRLNRMGMKVEPGSSEPADELELAELCIGEGLRATVTLVRIPRAEMPPRRDWLGQAERAL
jgi:hypothetical protein